MTRNADGEVPGSKAGPPPSIDLRTKLTTDLLDWLLWLRERADGGDRLSPADRRDTARWLAGHALDERQRLMAEHTPAELHALATQPPTDGPLLAPDVGITYYSAGEPEHEIRWATVALDTERPTRRERVQIDGPRVTQVCQYHRGGIFGCGRLRGHSDQPTRIGFPGGHYMCRYRTATERNDDPTQETTMTDQPDTTAAAQSTDGPATAPLHQIADFRYWPEPDRPNSYDSATADAYIAWFPGHIRALLGMLSDERRVQWVAADQQYRDRIGADESSLFVVNHTVEQAVSIAGDPGDYLIGGKAGCGCITCHALRVGERRGRSVSDINRPRPVYDVSLPGDEIKTEDSGDTKPEIEPEIEPEEEVTVAGRITYDLGDGDEPLYLDDTMTPNDIIELLTPLQRFILCGRLSWWGVALAPSTAELPGEEG